MKVILMFVLCFLFTMGVQAQFSTELEKNSKVKKISLAKKRFGWKIRRRFGSFRGQRYYDLLLY